MSFAKKLKEKKKKETLSLLKSVESKIRSGEMEVETSGTWIDSGTQKLHIKIVLVEKDDD